MQRTVGHDNALQLLYNFSRNLELALKKIVAKAQALVIDLLFHVDGGFGDHTPEGFLSRLLVSGALLPTLERVSDNQRVTGTVTRVPATRARLAERRALGVFHILPNTFRVLWMIRVPLGDFRSSNPTFLPHLGQNRVPSRDRVGGFLYHWCQTLPASSSL